jgi:hypothetical protein
MPKYQIHYAWHRHPKKSPDTIVVTKFIDVLTSIRRNLPHFSLVDKVVRLDSGGEKVIFSDGKWNAEALTEEERRVIKKYLERLGWEVSSLPAIA